MMKEDKEPIYIEFTEKNADPENNENAIDFNDRQYKKMTRKILLRLTSLRNKKQSDEEIFSKG